MGFSLLSSIVIRLGQLALAACFQFIKERRRMMTAAPLGLDNTELIRGGRLWLGNCNAIASNESRDRRRHV